MALCLKLGHGDFDVTIQLENLLQKKIKKMDIFITVLVCSLTPFTPKRDNWNLKFSTTVDGDARRFTVPLNLFDAQALGGMSYDLTRPEEINNLGVCFKDLKVSSFYFVIHF